MHVCLDRYSCENNPSAKKFEGNCLKDVMSFRSQKVNLMVKCDLFGSKAINVTLPSGKLCCSSFRDHTLTRQQQRPADGH